MSHEVHSSFIAGEELLKEFDDIHQKPSKAGEGEGEEMKESDDDGKEAAPSDRWFPGEDGGCGRTEKR